MSNKMLAFQRIPANLGRVLVGLGLVVLANAAVFAWTSTGGAQSAAVGSPTVCASYDLWGDALYVQPFFPPVAAALDGTAIEDQAVAVAINGLVTGNLTEANEKLAIDIVQEFLEEACEGVDRDAAPEATPKPTAAPEPTATPEPTAAPEPTATPEPGPTATPEPQPTEGPAPEPTTDASDVSDDDTSDDGSGDDGAATGATGADDDANDGSGGGALATTGAGPLTALLAFVGGGLVFAGAMVLAVEDRRRVPAY